MLNLELYQQILRDMRQHKIRSILTMFGIVWGTLTVVLLLALGESFAAANKKNLLSLSNGTLFVFPGKATKSYRGLPQGRKIALNADDVFALKKALPNINLITPIFEQFKTLSYQKQQVSASVLAIAPDYGMLAKSYPLKGGRFFNEIDIKKQNNVIFLSIAVRDKLFSNQNPIGKNVWLGKLPFTVIGIQKPLSQGSWYNNLVMIPYTTAIKLWSGINVSWFMVQPKDVNKSRQLQQQLLHYLSYQLKFDPTDPKAIQIINFGEIGEFINWFFNGIKLFLGFCGILTLIVGGIGVANIMYLIISERTAEIGLRMALGASEAHILQQFLLEAAVLIVGGSAIGFMLAASSIFILHHVSLPSWLGVPQFSMWIFLVTVLFLAVIGFVASYFPARRAAGMQPATALGF